MVSALTPIVRWGWECCTCATGTPTAPQVPPLDHLGVSENHFVVVCGAGDPVKGTTAIIGCKVLASDCGGASINAVAWKLLIRASVQLATACKGCIVSAEGKKVKKSITAQIGRCLWCGFLEVHIDEVPLTHHNKVSLIENGWFLKNWKI